MDYPCAPTDTATMPKGAGVGRIVGPAGFFGPCPRTNTGTHAIPVWHCGTFDNG
jgi:hypothetical protein